MTKLLYHHDSYLREFTATVTGIDTDSNGILLDQTAFYPGGGGQPHDKGVIEADGQVFNVTTIKRGNLHIVDGDVLPEVGAVVACKLDWERRYQLMRVHTAMHILSGVIWHEYGASVTGGNMDLLKGRMDFEFETMRRELVDAIEEKINAEVAADRPVRVAILPREEAFQIPDLIRTKINLLPEHITEIRTIEIVGLDLQADGGTHVKSTGEVGHIRVTDYKSKGGINKRIYIELDA
ncbi:MAG: alanyl-tRNA editing protein [Chloroflexi bacterium]|nr:MAG: Ala-tRNA(Pro) hydrolase [Phototrophicales bacterium]RMF80351.1 MAG: alanyl-tRNA editing protein [Chloroflexota bacterium]